VGEGIRPGAHELGAAVRMDLGLDDAGAALVDGPQRGDDPAVLPGEAEEKLASRRGIRSRPVGRDRPRLVPRGFLCRRRVMAAEAHQEAAFSAAWATVSRSAKPSSRTTSEPAGGRRTSTAGS